MSTYRRIERKTKEIKYVLINACKDICFAINTCRTKQMESGHNRGMIANEVTICMKKGKSLNIQSLVVIAPARRAGDPGSIPGPGENFSLKLLIYDLSEGYSKAKISS